MGCGSSKVAHSIVSIQHVSVHKDLQNKTPPPSSMARLLKTSMPSGRRFSRLSSSSSISHYSKSSIQIESDEKNNAKSPAPIVSYKKIKGDLIGRDSFQYIDESVSQVPFSSTSTLDELSDFFSQLADSDILKVRCMWIWVTKNIEHSDEPNDDPEPESIIESRKTNSCGFATLFRALLRKCGVHCKVVRGWCKYYGDSSEDEIKKEKLSPHYWNVVYLDDNWFLIDTYWGAGHLDHNKNFIKCYREHFFMADPSYLIYSHLPKNSTWQLIKGRVKRQTFEERAHISLHFSNTLIRFVSHEQRTINKDSEKIHIKFRDNKDIPIACEAVLKNKETNSLVECEVNIYKTEKIIHVVVNLPSTDGNYLLKILARKSEEKETLAKQLCCYEVIAKMNEKTSVVTIDNKYPVLYKKHTPGFYLFSPKEGTLQVLKNYYFKISLPDISNMAVCTGGAESGWYPMKKTKGTLWEVEVTIPNGTERVTVVAKLTNSFNTTFSSILAYQVSSSLDDERMDTGLL